MDIRVSGRHIEVTPAIRDYALEKVGKLPRYFDRVMEIEVIVDKREIPNLEVEILVRAEHTDPFIARVTKPDLYAAIDAAVDKIERQLTDHKERLRNRKHNGTPKSV